MNIVDGDKQPAPAKAMALDLLGLMGSSICDIFVHMKGLYSNKESLGPPDSFLASIVERYFSNSSNSVHDEEEVNHWEGPYRWTAEYLLEQNRQDENLQVILLSIRYTRSFKLLTSHRVHMVIIWYRGEISCVKPSIN